MHALPNFYIEKAKILCDYATLLWHKSFVDGNGGNLSLRVSESTFLCTPTMFSKRAIKEKDICLVDINGKLVHGVHKPSSEIMSHLAIYQANALVNAIIHTHPPYTCSYAFTESIPSKPISPESAIWMDNLYILPYMLPGSNELSILIKNASVSRTNLILQNHGLFTWGDTMEKAFWRTEVIENHCKISHLIESRGSAPRHFSDQELIELLEIKNRVNDNK